MQRLPLRGGALMLRANRVGDLPPLINHEGNPQVLESLRSFVGGWVAKILLVLLIGSFALWGVSESILGGANTNTVATIGETKVTTRDFLSTYNRNLSQVQRQTGRRLTREQARVFGIENRTLSSVVAYASLDEYARINGLSLSDDTMARMLAQNRQFQDSTGKFNRDTFRRAVYENRMRESEFIELQNRSAVRSQITQSFATGNILPDVFKSALASYTNEERKFAHLTITPAQAGTPPAPTDEQLKTYFEANLSKYRAPEYRKLEILSLEPKDLADQQTVTDEEIAADYQAREASYKKPEQRRVQQIVFKSQTEADAAVKALSEGAVFETILSDNKVKLTDADLGLLPKDQLPAAIQEAAFSAELNTISDIIKGPFGPTMIRVTEVSPAETTPLAKVKDDIRKELALRKAAEAVVSMQETIEDSRAGGTSLIETGKRLKLKVRTVEAIDRTARTPDDTIINDLPSSASLLEQAFQTQVGAQAAPIELGATGYLWYDVAKITEARDRKQDEVTEKLKTDWIAAEQAKLNEKKAEELKARIEKGATLSQIATELNLLEKNTLFLKRNGRDEGFPNTAVQAGFKGDAKAVSIVDGEKAGEKMIITIAEIKGNDAQATSVPDEQVKLANEGAADDLLNQMISNIQSSFEVTQNPAAINQALTQGY